MVLGPCQVPLSMMSNHYLLLDEMQLWSPEVALDVSVEVVGVVS